MSAVSRARSPFQKVLAAQKARAKDHIYDSVLPQPVTAKCTPGYEIGYTIASDATQLANSWKQRQTGSWASTSLQAVKTDAVKPAEVGNVLNRQTGAIPQVASSDVEDTYSHLDMVGSQRVARIEEATYDRLCNHREEQVYGDAAGSSDRKSGSTRKGASIQPPGRLRSCSDPVEARWFHGRIEREEASRRLLASGTENGSGLLSRHSV